MDALPGHQFRLQEAHESDLSARLNRIGINIAQPYDVTRHSVVMICRAEEIVTSDVLELPEFYRHAPRRVTCGWWPDMCIQSERPCSYCGEFGGRWC
ncbi:hypothetical protein [Pseudomonas aeruginosa]|uniref:hypothetical protein n=1 Tax=Pseudomonas aeruginosa TaxID=287 RepID=UPI0012FD306A|nr:hypothetical protein [Pseudomonas aeruginosa]